MAGYPSSGNTYIASHEASGAMVIEYSRNVEDFSLNKYARIVPVTKDQGYYLEITAEQAARMVDSSGRDRDWHDGHEAPTGDGNQESHNFQPYMTARKCHPFMLGQKAVQQASWDILASHSRIACQEAMTYRTQLANTVFVTSGNWGGNTATASSLAGGYLDQSTATTMLIKKAFLRAAKAILLATLGKVKQKDICAIMNPTTAERLSESQELVDFLKQSPAAMAQVRGDVPSENGVWGLPDVMYNTRLVVEDAVKVTSKKGATKATSFIHSDGTIVFASRPDGFTGVDGAPSYATLTLFVFEEMTVEHKSDPDNRRVAGRVVDDFVAKVTAPASGYLLTSCLSS